MTRDEESYKQVLINNNVTEEEVQEQVNRKDVMHGIPHLYTKASTIHGTGCFTSRAVRKGGIIGPTKIRDLWTIAGRFSNHSANPNAFSKSMGKSFALIARRDIKVDEEVTVDYQQVIDVNKQARQ